MKIAVSSSDELIRLDLFLAQRLVQFSRTNIQKMISNQSIKVNGEWTKKNSALNYGDIIEIDLTNKDNLEETLLEKWKYPLDVLYQDKDFAIVNKPRGIIVHPTKGNYNKTLVNIILDTFPYPGITTSLESIFMGVPLLTKNGSTYYSKIGTSINKNLNMTDWIADNNNEYIQKAIKKSYEIKNSLNNKKKLIKLFSTSLNISENIVNENLKYNILDLYGAYQPNNHQKFLRQGTNYIYTYKPNI